MVVLFPRSMLCLTLEMAINIDGAGLMKVASNDNNLGMWDGTTLEDLEKLLEEANGGLEEKIRKSNFEGQFWIGR